MPRSTASADELSRHRGSRRDEPSGDSSKVGSEAGQEAIPRVKENKKAKARAAKKSRARRRSSPEAEHSPDFVNVEESEEFKAAGRKALKHSRQANDSDVEKDPDSDVEKDPDSDVDKTRDSDVEKDRGSDAGKHPSPSGENDVEGQRFDGSDAENSRDILSNVGGVHAADGQAEDDDDCRIVDSPKPKSGSEVKLSSYPPRAPAAVPQEQNSLKEFTSKAASATADIIRSSEAEANMRRLQLQLEVATKKASEQRLEQETAQEAVDLLQKSVDEATKQKRAHELEMAARLLQKIDSPAKIKSAGLPELPPQSNARDSPRTRSDAHDEWLLRSALEDGHGLPSGRKPAVVDFDESRVKTREDLLEKVRQLEHAQHADRTDFVQLRKENDGFAYQKFDLNIQIRELTERAEAAEAQVRPVSVHERLANAEYASRFQMLLQAGHAIMDVHQALETTKISGTWSAQRAVLFLQKQQKERLTLGVAKANEQESDLPNIVESSALAKLLCEKLEFADIICKVRELHAKQRARNAHQAKPAVVAANLVELPVVKGDAQLQRCGYAFLCRIASAVSEDCEQCKTLRDKLESDEQWKLKAAAARAEREKADKAKELKKSAEALEAHKRQREPDRLRDAPFKLSDSKRDLCKPRVPCTKCNLGQEGGKWVLFCSTSNCSKAYHYQCCLEFIQYRLPNGKTRFACESCQKQRQDLLAAGVEQEAWEIVIQPGEAPDHGEAIANGAGGAAFSRAKDFPRTTGDSTLATPQGMGTGTLASANFSSGSTETDSARKLLNFSTEVFDGKEKAKTNITVKDYFRWDSVPEGWAPKPDALGITNPEHPTHGYGKAAYTHWRRQNVTNRDMAKAAGSSLGPLTRGIAQEMKVTVGNIFLDETHLPGLWTQEASMTTQQIDDWVSEWIRIHPKYDWVDKITDETLLLVLDKKFGVTKPTLFLSKRYPANLSLLDSSGNICYHVATFNTWATQWENELNELKASGCDFSGVDLKAVLLNALSTNRTLWKEASEQGTTSTVRLLAHMRTFVMVKDEAARTARNELSHLRSLEKPAAGQTPTDATASNDTTAAALLSMVQQLQDTVSSLSRAPNSPAVAGVGAKNTHLKPLNPHMRVCKDPAKCRCNGCGNAWVRRLRVPCFKTCTFVEHPKYNKECNTKDFAPKDGLTWKNFREEFPTMKPYPANFLLYEENQKLYQSKQKRTPDT